MIPKSYFHPGQKVICVKHSPGDLIRKGKEYIIENVKVYNDGTYGICVDPDFAFFYKGDSFKPKEVK